MGGVAPVRTLRLADQPLFLLMAAVGSAAMFGPAALALALQTHAEARSFAYAGLLGLILLAFVALARAHRPRRRSLMHNLAALLAGFALLPVWLAVPFHDALPTTSFLNAYLEMTSALTTTGATLFPGDRLSPSLHLWRALIGWLGGLMMMVAAAAVLAPLSLGGFEVTASAEPGQDASRLPMQDRVDPQHRILRVVRLITPIYAGLTGALWVLLMILGEVPLTALCHAMSTLATSGISPVGGLQNGQAGLAGEAVIALFLLFALSRLTFSSDTLTTDRSGIAADPEFRLGLAIVGGVTLALFLRHWSGAYTVDDPRSLGDAARSLWGSAFTVLSFLTTAGFESADWAAARFWSGLTTPGTILMGLALIGGGVATTAGGVKLLRVWALYLNTTREMDRLIHPNSVGHSIGHNRRLRKQGAFIAWVFFMLFALILIVTVAGFTLFGSGFEAATILSIAALTNTGPLVAMAGDAPIPLADLTAAAKLWLALAMVLGRLEMLAIVALITSDLWQSWSEAR